MDALVPVCPLISTRGSVLELCLGEQCAWFIAPVRKCSMYVLGHKGAIDLQSLQREYLASHSASSAES